MDNNTLKFGICMEGLEGQFSAALLHQANAERGRPFCYLEIGVAYCQTFESVCRLLAEGNRPWKAIAIDPADFVAGHFMPLSKNNWPIQWIQATREMAFFGWTDPLDFVFIDGCHSATCAMADFNACEPFVSPGGIVVFHDAGESSRGQKQPHCDAPSDVYGAIETLGLKTGDLPYWRHFADWFGDKSRNGADCAVFTKLT